ncbi:MAG TPA: alpha/beta fold hydrolase [Streptosporangiaceae bacterium]|nr:alpha/beta fold hydrolase [Streptosporangiaceae bacterium]
MAYLKRDGVRIFYESHGGDRGSGGPLPLLLSHGFGSSSRMWAPNVAALAAGRRVITWDLRGHGQSDAPQAADQYSGAACVADMAALLDAAGAQRAVLGGLSLGGYLSLSFCVAHPERVAALVLCDTGPGFRKDEARQRWNDRALAQAARIEREGSGALGADASLHDDALGVARAARGILTQHDASVIDSLPRIAVPVLVVVGSEDAAFLGAADYMAGKIPGAALTVIEGAGHVSNVDQPAQFNEAVTGFLAGLG